MREPEFDIAAMEEALRRCDANITVFEEAIQKEQATKREYRRILEDLKFKRDHPRPKAINIAVDRDRLTDQPIDVTITSVDDEED